MRHYLLIACLLLGLLTSCEKSDIVAANATTDDGSTPLLYTLIQQNAAAAQSFDLSPSTTPTRLTTVHGNIVTVRGSSFVRFDASNMSSSPIKLQVEEANDRADFLFTRLPTVTVEWEGSQLLESAGMIRVRAYQDDKPLELASGEVVQITTRNSAKLSTSTGIQLFSSFLGPAEDFGWQSVPNDSISTIQPNLTNTGFVVTVGSKAFNRGRWLSCSRLVPGSIIPVRVQATSQNTSEGDFTHVFMVYNNLNSLDYTPYMSDQGLATLPILSGARVTAIVVRVTKDQTFYYGEQTATVTGPFTFTPKLSALPAATIITRIRQAAQ
ncbi:hypothetical protein F1C16_10445 [Hymenobacter sp. NBH84]|uniref:hypothetical protein n=1 Tax=Hymenobacter sp. NBH84 TaxID=2596915 RepID=UPI0016257F21|nr:hypothetical protein [Hymenobacter sp. NBH84]QNE39946.1 hypothetical protein F1C16_10445 [Hymenobacter sp. NBH84]